MDIHHRSFPDEIIWRILSFTSPLDIAFSARLVSKQFRDITYDTQLWRVLYANARLPRPPGPFPSQSILYLERTLVRSALVAHSWITEPYQEIRCTEVPITSDEPYFGSPARFVCGRYFVNCESSTNIMLHDTDMDGCPKRNLWHNEAPISQWDARSIGEEQLFIFITEYQRGTVRKFKLLEYKLDAERVPVFCSSWDVPETGNKNFFNLVANNFSPFMYLLGLGLIFDTGTKMFYDFPNSPTDIRGQRPFPREANDTTFLTTSHILVCARRPESLWGISGGGVSSIIRAFTTPLHDQSQPPPNRLSSLCLTHECKITNNDLPRMELIRDSFVDPTTETTTIKFLFRAVGTNGFHLTSLDLLLPRSTTSTSDILPISVDTYNLFSIDLPPFRRVALFVQACHDGHARGFYFSYSRPREGGPGVCHCVKFTIDAAQDRSTALVGEPARVEAKGEYASYSNFPSWFDGVRGRVCFNSYKQVGMDSTTPFIVDIK